MPQLSPYPMLSEEMPAHPGVLVVGATTAQREVIAHRLRSLGIRVEEVPHPEAAERLLVRARPGLVVLDASGQIKQVLGLVRRLKADPERESIHLLLLVTRWEQERSPSLLASGADDLVVKPFRLEEVVDRVQVGLRLRTLQRRRVSREVTRAVKLLARTLAGRLSPPAAALGQGLTAIEGFLTGTREATPQECAALLEEHRLAVEALAALQRELAALGGEESPEENDLRG